MASTSERIYVVRSGTSAIVSTPVALVAATPKTVVSVLGSAADTISLKRARVSFASVTGTDVPATVEIGITSAAGTVGTAFVPVQIVGSTLASSCAAGYNHSGEPTYNRVFESLYCPVNNGLADWYYPLGEEPGCDPGQGFAIRVTSPQAQNCFASLWYSE